MKFLKLFFLTCSVLSLRLNAQTEFQFYLLNSYVTEEAPQKLSVSFLTTQPAKTEIIIFNSGRFQVSGNFKTNHSFQIDLKKLKKIKKNISYILKAENRSGQVFYSDTFFVELTVDQLKEIVRSKSILPVIYLGVLTFFTPMPGIINGSGANNVVTLNKELPVLNFGTDGRKYPYAFISVEYSYALNRSLRNLGGIGISFLQPIKFLEYFSAGISLITDFHNNYGVSPNVSIGLFNIYGAFTVFVKYQYDYFKAKSLPDFHEIKLGLYAKFFSINF